MPVENERKYVLSLDSPEIVFSELASAKKNIEQSYLICMKKQSARIRKSQIFYPNGNVKYSFTFTFKQDVANKTIEVETDITKQDYLLLKKESCLSFNKTRYEIDNWEIDYFKLNGETYFIQAEIELPENCRKPNQIHPIIQKHLLHVVKRGDGRFSSKKLGDMKYAKKLLQTLTKEIE